MPFVVLPCTPDDLRRCCLIQWQASAINPLWQLIFPNNGTQALVENGAYHMRREYDDPTVHVYKVVDTSNPDTPVAYAKWTVVKSGSGSLEGDKTPPKPPQVPEGDTNEHLFDQFIGDVTPIRQAHLSGPTIVLDNLSVDPANQRQGAGKLLVDTLVNFADETGLPCYVESTPAAREMYIHRGFREVDRVDIDLGRWEQGFGMYRTTILSRDAHGRGQEE